MEPDAMASQVRIDFACVGCARPVGLTVHRRGCGEQLEVAAVLAPCPCCGQINHVMFDPDGSVRSVGKYTSIRDVPEPSVN
jgi:hypothetical protein